MVDESKVLKLASKGLLQPEIAAQTGVTQPRVSQILKKHRFKRIYAPESIIDFLSKISDSFGES